MSGDFRPPERHEYDRGTTCPLPRRSDVRKFAANGSVGPIIKLPCQPPSNRTSASPPKADTISSLRYVRLGPTTAVSKCSRNDGYSITLSARATRPAGTSSPIALAACRLITSSNLAGCSTGISAGIPWRIFTTIRASWRNISVKRGP